MKTRTLLLLAVTVGLIILIAGSVKLFLIAEDEPSKHLHVPGMTKVGDMSVTVRSVRVEGGQLLVSVELVGVDDPDGAASWVFGNGSGTLHALAPPPGTGEPCASTSATEPTDCVLAFATADARGVLGYQRAGTTVRWDVVGEVPAS